MDDRLGHTPAHHLKYQGLGPHLTNDFALSLKPVIERVPVAFASAQEEVVGTKTDCAFQDRLDGSVAHNDWVIH